MKEFGDFMGDMFKHFPKFTIFFIFLVIYGLWRSGGGIERGEARRIAGDNGVFLQVQGVPESYGEDELFGSVPAKDVEEVSEN